MVDLAELSDWFHAEARWRSGDPRPLADYVIQWGAPTEDRRRALAVMLTTKPDPRKEQKPGTAEMLAEVERLMQWRADLVKPVLAGLPRYLERIRKKLRARGWDETAIQGVLSTKRPGLIRPPKAPTNDDIFAEVARRRKLTPEAVEKAWKRERKRRKTEALAGGGTQSA